MDISTSVGESPLRVNFPAGHPAGDLLQRVARSVLLRTWPELEAVEITTEAVEFSEAKFPTRTDSTVRPYVPMPSVLIKPVVRLADRWYVLSVEAQPDRYFSEQFHFPLPDGSMGARFRVGSQLAVREVRHVMEQGASYVIVEFTERVRVASGASPEIRAGSTPLCGMARGAPTPDAGVRALAFSCGTAEPPADISMHLAGIAGLGGATLTPIPLARTAGTVPIGDRPLDVKLAIRGAMGRVYRP
jgi:hypothetical protein